MLSDPLTFDFEPFDDALGKLLADGGPVSCVQVGAHDGVFAMRFGSGGTTSGTGPGARSPSARTIAA